MMHTAEIFQGIFISLESIIVDSSKGNRGNGKLHNHYRKEGNRKLFYVIETFHNANVGLFLKFIPKFIGKAIKNQGNHSF